MGHTEQFKHLVVGWTFRSIGGAGHSEQLERMIDGYAPQTNDLKHDW